MQIPQPEHLSGITWAWFSRTSIAFTGQTVAQPWQIPQSSTLIKASFFEAFLRLLVDLTEDMMLRLHDVSLQASQF